MQALENYMQVAGLTQEQLARRLGVSQSQLNHWLQKRRSPTIQRLKQISESTGIKLEILARDL